MMQISAPLSAAERMLYIDGDEKEALQLALQESSQLKVSGNRRGSVEAARCAVSALLRIAKVASLRSKDDAATEAIARATKLAEDELQEAKAQNDFVAQASMLLSMSEIHAAGEDGSDRNKAMQKAREAETILRAQQDEKLMAHALLQLAHLQCSSGDYQQAKSNATACTETFGRLEQIVAESDGFEALSRIHLLRYDFKEAIKALQKSVELLRAAGKGVLYAGRLTQLGDIMLQHGDGFGALEAGKESYAIFQDLKYGRGMESKALALVVRCDIALGQKPKAYRMAKAAVGEFKSRGGKDDTDLYQAMMALSSVKQAEDKQEEAAAILEEALALCRQNKHQASEGQALEALASMYEKSKDSEKALELAEQAADFYATIGDKKKEISTLVNAVVKLQLQLDQGKEAAATAERARNMADKIDDVNLQASAALGLFAASMLLLDADSALRAARDARELFEEDGDRKGEAKALQCLSRCYCGTEQYRLAIRAAEEELELQREMGDKVAVGSALLSISNIHLLDNRPKEAIQMARESLGVFTTEGAVGGQVHAHLNVAKANDALLKNLGPNEAKGSQFNENFSKGVKAAKEAIRTADQIQDQNLEASALYWSGSLYAVAGKSQDTIQAATESLSLYRQSKDQKGEVRAQSLIGQAMILKQKLKEAKSALDKALDLATEIDDTEGMKMVKELLREAEPRKAAAAAGPVTVMQAAPAAGEASAASAAAPAAGSAVAAYTAPDPEVVKERISALVGDMTGEAADPETPFMDSGIDSLASVELRTNLQKTFGVSLPSTVMFNYPTASAMATFLVDEMTENQISL